MTASKARLKIAAAEEVAPEAQVLRDGQRGFAGVAVGDVVGLLAQGQIRRATLECYFAKAGFAQIGEQAEQG